MKKFFIRDIEGNFYNIEKGFGVINSFFTMEEARECFNRFFINKIDIEYRKEFSIIEIDVPTEYEVIIQNNNLVLKDGHHIGVENIVKKIVEIESYDINNLANQLKKLIDACKIIYYYKEISKYIDYIHKQISIWSVYESPKSIDLGYCSARHWELAETKELLTYQEAKSFINNNESNEIHYYIKNRIYFDAIHNLEVFKF